VLAGDVTTLVHGADECAKAIAASEALFGRGDLRGLDEATLAAALAEAGLTRVPATPDRMPTVVDLLAATRIEGSKSAARRAIAAGGAYLNNRKVADEDAVPEPADLLHGRYLVLRRGRRTVAGVEIVTG
jgi:tyrosyl-tRNA synthetase